MTHNAEQELTILLFEDDEGHAELVKMNLARSGVNNKIVHVSNGNEGIKFLLESCPSLRAKLVVILDLNMPGMDGHQVLDCIKNSANTKKIPVVVLTTAADENIVERCYKQGCNLYINKSINYEDFSGAILKLALLLKTIRVPSVYMP